MSRSTGWQSPAVPPAESTSQPGEKERAHPIGTWGRCVGFCCRPTTSLSSESTNSPIRRAFLLRGRMCLIVLSFPQTSVRIRGSLRLLRHIYSNRYQSNRESNRSSADSRGRCLHNEQTPHDGIRRHRADAQNNYDNRTFL